MLAACNALGIPFRSLKGPFVQRGLRRRRWGIVFANIQPLRHGFAVPPPLTQREAGKQSNRSQNLCAFGTNTNGVW